MPRSSPVVRRTSRVLRAVAAVVVGAAPVGASTAAPTSTAATRPFAASSSFNTPLPAAPTVDWNSTWKVQTAAAAGVNANLVEFGIPVYAATTSTPRYSVPCSRQPVWGTCPLSGRAVPIPVDARPHTGSDGAMVVVDQANRLVYEFWQAVRSSRGSWTASWGSVTPLDGSGWGSTATGAGASRLAGVVRLSEIRAGTIPHALVLQSDNTCASTFVAPATKTDGSSTRADCLREGTRVQLDPSIDVDALDLRPAERAVAKALQTYGAFVVDRGGAGLSMSFELDPQATGDDPGATYAAAGLSWDYDDMSRIPWRSLRIVTP